MDAEYDGIHGRSYNVSYISLEPWELPVCPRWCVLQIRGLRQEAADLHILKR